MFVLTYFKKKSEGLPDPRGPLSTKIPTPSIVAANKEIEAELSSAKATGKPQGADLKLNERQKADNAAYATEKLNHFSCKTF